jgi:DNA-binding transcriptional ArsR family regulator
MPAPADRAVKESKAPAAGLATVFFALGDKTRLQMIALLCAGGALSIAQLTSNTDLTRQAVTKHLEVLAGAGLVQHVKVGRERLWQFEPGQVEAARKSLEMIGQQWESALRSLKQFVEEGEKT